MRGVPESPARQLSQVEHTPGLEITLPSQVRTAATFNFPEQHPPRRALPLSGSQLMGAPGQIAYFASVSSLPSVTACRDSVL